TVLVFGTPKIWPDDPAGYRALLAWVVPVAAVVVGLAVLAWRSPPGRRAQMTMYSVIAVILVAAVDIPVDSARPVIDTLRTSGGPTYITTPPTELTSGLLGGYDYLRRNSGDDAVLAVSNALLSSEKTGESTAYFDPAAFAERRVLLEGWGYTSRAHQIGDERVYVEGVQPFPDRLRLEKLAFERASRGALAALRGRLSRRQQRECARRRQGTRQVDPAHPSLRPRGVFEPRDHGRQGRPCEARARELRRKLMRRAAGGMSLH